MHASTSHRSANAGGLFALKPMLNKIALLEPKLALCVTLWVFASNRTVGETKIKSEYYMCNNLSCWDLPNVYSHSKSTSPKSHSSISDRKLTAAGIGISRIGCACRLVGKISTDFDRLVHVIIGSILFKVTVNVSFSYKELKKFMKYCIKIENLIKLPNSKSLNHYQLIRITQPQAMFQFYGVHSISFRRK